MDRETAKEITDAMRIAVINVAEAYDLELSKLNCRYGDADVKFSITLDGVAEDGLTKEAQAYETYAASFGIMRKLGEKFTCRGTVYEITGLKPNRHKYPICAKRCHDGRKFKFQLEAVQ